MIVKGKITGSFEDAEAGTLYRRIVGGLAWPFGDRPGYLVVVAEDFNEDRALNERPFNIIAERQAPDLDEIVRHYKELTSLFLAGPWVGDPANKGMFLHCQGKAPKFFLDRAPHFDDARNLEYYFQLIRTLTKESRKVLHFNNHDMIRGYLEGLSAEELNKSAKEHPPAAALGYAVTYLDQNKPVKQSRSRRRRDGIVV